MSTNTRPPGLRGQTCPNDDDHPAHEWTSTLVEPTGETVWCLGQPATDYRVPVHAPASSRLMEVLLSAAHFAAKFAAESGVDLTSASIDLEDGRPEIYLVLDDFDGRLNVEQLERATARLELDQTVEGEGWRQYSHEFDDVDVFLDVWSREPRSARTPARSARRYMLELTAATRRDPYLDVALLSTAALGAAVALTARRVFRR